MNTRSRDSSKITFLGLLPAVAIILAVLYLMVRTILFIASDYTWYEKIVGLLLLLAETFMLFHGIGYFLLVLRGASGGDRRSSSPPSESEEPETEPHVAVIVSSYKEPLPVIQDTVACLYGLSYPNKRVYFLDDTRYDQPGQDPSEMRVYRQAIEDMCKEYGVDLFRRRWHGAKAGMINDFLDFVEGRQKEGFEFTDFSGQGKVVPPEYIAVFDADQNPMPGFLQELVTMMEKDPGLAFVQTPQYYSNFESNRIARAAGLQQAVFYEYICEGKSISDAMFCCGTNVVFRRKALMEVGGFDEESVTEDFATSLAFHLKGWHSAYVSRVGTFGMGPEDLGGYFKQQFRWALGTVGLLRRIVRSFFGNPRAMTTVRWWEYLLSTTYYFTGLIFLILILCPLLYIFFRVPSYFESPVLYVLFFVPYFVMSLTTFLWVHRQRRYGILELLSGQLLVAIAFPVYVKASILAIAGVKGSFGVTTKTGAASLPLKALWAQIGLATVSFTAFVWGINRLIYEREPFLAIAVNMFWCIYHCAILLSVLYFNNPKESKE